MACLCGVAEPVRLHLFADARVFFLFGIVSVCRRPAPLPRRTSLGDLGLAWPDCQTTRGVGDEEEDDADDAKLEASEPTFKHNLELNV